MMPPKRKKWSEAEEKTLIDKYENMVADGSLAKMKTREKKFRPIACHVNSVHYLRDPIAYPWPWTWKDVSTKVQNMRHQYLLVKQKIRKPGFTSVENSGGDCIGDEFDWMEGLTHWSNFLRYKEVFGDVPLSHGHSSDMMANANSDREHGGGFLDARMSMDMVAFGQIGHAGEGDFGAGIDGVDNGVGFEHDGDDGDVNYSQMREDAEHGYANEETEVNRPNLKKRKVFKGLEKKACKFLASQLRKLREVESQFDQRELEREKERRRMESFQVEHENELERKWAEREKEREEREKDLEKSRRQRISEWEAMEKEGQEMEKKRREKELFQEREWDERMNRNRSEWKKRVDEMLNHHRAEMSQIQTRILHEQQNLTSQLLGIVSQWTAHPSGLSDHTSTSNHYLSQMMQNLHHVNAMAHHDPRVDGDNQEDQFIVDG